MNTLKEPARRVLIQLLTHAKSFIINAVVTMKTITHLANKLQLATLSATLLGAALVSSLSPANAAVFGQEEVRQRDFIAIAAPVGTTARRSLLIVEQQASTRPCWSESGSEPTIVEPLLLNFDFSGICGRATDSNAYSVRVGGEDLGINYTLSLVRSGDDVVLMANPYRGNGPSLEIGRAGYTEEFSKVVLNPGWRFTKRTYQGRTLGHIYLTHDSTLAELSEASGNIATAPAPSTPVTSPIALPTPPMNTPVATTPVTDDTNLDWRDRLELNEVQRLEIERIHTNYLGQRDARELALVNARNELQQNIFSGDRRQARRTRTQIRTLHRELADLYYTSLNDMRNVMDSEQQIEFGEIVTRRSTLNGDDAILTGMIR
jgi:Spy/CpxP family protein refolding chaperone